MILTDEGIAEAVKDGKVRISPYSPDQLQPASYDLRVGSEGITTRSERTIDIEEKGLLILSPGDFGIVVTSRRDRTGSEAYRPHRAAQQVCPQGHNRNGWATDRPGLPRAIEDWPD